MNVRSLVVAATLAAWPSLSAAQSPDLSNLGSPREAGTRYSADYKAIVKAALPSVTADELAERVKAAVIEEAAERPLAVADARTWGALFGVDAPAGAMGDELVEGDLASYLVSPDAGRLYIALRGEPKAYPREAYGRLLPQIRAAHKELAEKIGIPSRQVLFTDFRETLAQSTPRRLGEIPDGPIESVGATSTFVRAVGGLLVDGSSFRVSSLDAERIDMAEVRWPRLVLAPEVDANRVIAPSQLAERLVDRISANEKGRPVSVRMAVVLRPVASGRGSAFVPALRVQVQPQSVKRADGVSTEAGEEFYLNLVSGLPALEEGDGREVHENVPSENR
jgi:hypothetical protein